MECDLRRLSPRTTKSYYNNTVLFLNFLDKHLQIRELESIRPPHIKKYIQYLLDRDQSSSSVLTSSSIRTPRIFAIAFNSISVAIRVCPSSSERPEGSI